MRKQSISNAIFYAIVLFVVVILAWAAYAEIDEVTRSDGSVVPSSQTKIVQSFDGGILRALHVQGGDAVTKGQVLAELDTLDSQAELDKARYEQASLAAARARLEAQAQFEEPDFGLEVLQGYPQVELEQYRLYHAQRSELDLALRVLEAKLSQRRQELITAQAQKEKHQRLIELTRSELGILRPLVKKGIEPRLSLIKAEQNLTAVESDYKLADLTINKAQQAIEEMEQEIETRRQSFKVQSLKELSEVVNRLALVEKTLPSLAEKVKRAAIVSPINGIVNQVMINTLGGVVQPAMPLIEVVPVDDQLVVEARVLPEDVAFVVPGQPAKIKITAYDFAQYGAVEGEVVTVSPDAITEQDGSTYYLARIETQTSTLQAFGESYPIIPGMQSQVDFISGKRSVLEYMVKPMLKIKANAFSER